MGFSCLWFTFAFGGMLFAFYLGERGSHSRTGLAAIISILSSVFGLFGFLADYYFTRFAESESEIVPVPWWKKHEMFHRIDLFTAKLGILIAFTVWCLQLLPKKHRMFYVKMGTMPYSALVCLYIARRYMEGYVESMFQDADAIWWHFFWHSMWHFLCSATFFVQTYGLVAHGLQIPGTGSRMSDGLLG